MSDDEVAVTLDKANLLEILTYAAGRDRTVIELRTTENADGERELSHAIDISEHVEAMEEGLEDGEHPIEKEMRRAKHRGEL